MPINNFETAVRSCFGEDSIETLWYGGTEGMIGDNPNKMYVAITEGADWWQNKCILRGWFFDYEKFEKLPLHIDCADYGVYVFWEEEEEEYCEEHEQPMWKDGLKCGGCLEKN